MLKRHNTSSAIPINSNESKLKLDKDDDSPDEDQAKFFSNSKNSRKNTSSGFNFLQNVATESSTLLGNLSNVANIIKSNQTGSPENLLSGSPSSRFNKNNRHTICNNFANASNGKSNNNHSNSQTEANTNPSNSFVASAISTIGNQISASSCANINIESITVNQHINSNINSTSIIGHNHPTNKNNINSQSGNKNSTTRDNHTNHNNTNKIIKSPSLKFNNTVRYFLYFYTRVLGILYQIKFYINKGETQGLVLLKLVWKFIYLF